MNRDDIIRMAREVGMQGMLTDVVTTLDEIERFAVLVATAEREACALVCKETNSASFRETGCPAEGGECAAAIRARGEGFVRKTHQFSNKTIEPQERTPDYLEKCPNCNGPADNGFDRSWPDPNPYFCTKCMKTMEY